jgi:hypothetical protein
MSDTQQPGLVNSVLSFTQAHRGVVQLLDVLVTTRQLPPGWDRYGDHLDVLNCHRHAVTTFLVLHGKETPEVARQAVANLLGACWRARQDIDQTGLAYLDLARIRDVVAATAEPVLQALRLHAHELEKRLQDLTERAGDVPPRDAPPAPPALEPEWTKADNVAGWAKVFGLSCRAMSGMLKEQTVRNKRLNRQAYQLAIDDLPASEQKKYGRPSQ